MLLNFKNDQEFPIIVQIEKKPIIKLLAIYC